MLKFSKEINWQDRVMIHMETTIETKIRIENKRFIRRTWLHDIGYRLVLEGESGYAGDPTKAI